MYKITYDNIDDLRKKLNEIKNRDENINIECVEENLFKVDITETNNNNNRTELIYKDGSLKEFVNYRTSFGEKGVNIKYKCYEDGRECHSQWFKNKIWWDGEFKDGKRHGKQRWWWGNNTVMKESIWNEGNFIKSYSYHDDERCSDIEYGKLSDFLKELEKAKSLDKEIKFGNDIRYMGFASNGVWHNIRKSKAEDTLKSFKVKLQEISKKRPNIFRKSFFRKLFGLGT